MTQTEQPAVDKMKRQELIRELHDINERRATAIPFNESMPLAALRKIVIASRGQTPEPDPPPAPAQAPAASPPDPNPVEAQEAVEATQEPQEAETAPDPVQEPARAVTEAQAPAEPEPEAEPVAVEDAEIAQAIEVYDRSRAAVRSNPGLALPAAEEFNAALAVAERLANSRVVPRDYQNRPDDVLAAYMFGKELGMGIMTALRDLYMIDGRAAIAAHRQLGIIRAGGVQIIESESTAERAYIKAKRSDTGEVMAVEFTMEQAKKVTRKGKPLIDGDNWKSYPEDMLWARCVGRLSRRLAPDILGGSLPPYVAEEVADFEGWNVEYGSQGQLGTRPAARQEQPVYNVPKSWVELRARFELNTNPGEPEAVDVWFQQAMRAVVPEAESIRSLDKPTRDKVWAACAQTLYDLEQMGLEAIQFNEDPRSVIAQAFAKHLDGVMLEGPPWKLGPNESDLPDYEPAAEVVAGEVVHEGGE